MNRSYQEVLESVARPSIPDDLDLFPRVTARLNQRRTFMQTLRARPVLAMTLAVLALLLLTGVAYAIGRLTGYIPGIGFVQTSSLRVLDESVSQTREGITVSIEQVVVDSERTIIVYKAEGLTIQAANSKGEGGEPFGSFNLLRLPDGTTLEESREFNGTPEPLLNNITTEGGWPNYVQRLVYRSVPPQVNELTLVIPVLQNMPVGAAPENWEITFKLKPAPADMNYAPIIEFIPAPSEVATVTPAAGETSVPALSSTATKNGFTLQLDNVIELEDGFVFTGNLSWDDSAFPTAKDIFPDAIRPVLTDANGQEVPIEEVPLDWSNQKNKLSWSYRTNRKAFAGPLTLSVSYAKATLLAPPVDLQIDLGPNPQVGQTWEVNQDFSFNDHTVHLSSIQVNGDCAPQMYSLIFNFTSNTAGADGSINDLAPQDQFDYSCEGGGGMWQEGRPIDSTDFSIGIPYNMIPSGMRQFTVNLSMPYVVEGPWQVTWTPPLTSEPTVASPAGACLTLDLWNQLANRNDPLPAGLGGQVITTVDEGWRLPGIYASNLDGSNLRKVDMGAWPSLSTDGTRLAYSIDDGIHIFNLASSENSALGMDGYRIIWSPDNSRLMYTTTFTLNIVNADGTGLLQVDTGSAQVIAPSGWLPDNQTIIFSTIGGDGFTFRSHNLQSGETKELFTIQNKTGYGSVSPDGQWLVFADRVFGANNWGIFISRLDGSERKQVVATEVPTAFTSVWGPDGQWLIVNTTKQDGTMIPVLVNPFTCQVARLSNFNGMIEGWSR
jgi:hypothetical protein